MLHWISANLSTILITLVLIAIVVLIIRSLICQKKQESPPAAQGAPTAPCMASATAASRDLIPGETWAAPRLPSLSPRRLDMSNCPQAMTPASIRYLLVLDDLCREGKGVRSVEIAARMNVSKPSAHSMLQNLCQAGLVEKERYGTVFLTPEGRRAAAEYAACFGPCAAGCSRPWAWRRTPVRRRPAPSWRSPRTGCPSSGTG